MDNLELLRELDMVREVMKDGITLELLLVEIELLKSIENNIRIAA